MNLTFVIDSLGSGGAQRQLVETAVHLHQVGAASVTVVQYHPQDFFGPRLEAAGVQRVQIHRSDPLFPWKLRSAIQSTAPDVVHSFLLTPGLWAWLSTRGASRPRFVAAERNSRIATDWREAALQRWLYRRADAVTVNAAPVVDEIASRLGVPPSRICYVPNGIDLEAWDTSSSAQPTLQVPTNGLHFAVVGGFRPQKNHALLFRTLGSMGKEARRGWTFWCVGDETAGSEEARAVRQLAAELDLGDCVQFAPATPELAAFLGRMDGLVLPSAWEGFPNVVLEALAARVPVVATRVGDVAALVEPGRSGWLVEAGDEPALAASLRELADLLPEERARMGQAGRSRVEQKFQMASIAERYMALYLRLQEDAR